jgi:hypothetical protein
MIFIDIHRYFLLIEKERRPWEGRRDTEEAPNENEERTILLSV